MKTKQKYTFNSIPEIVDDIKQGKMIILVDDENRENEGDLVVAAEKITPEIITFMAKKGSGLICLPMSEKHIERLNLNQMVHNNTANRSTAFTISIEAREGITTGISAYDRAKTILTAVDKNSKPEDLSRPGHIFPLKAAEGGVLFRPGQTEGSIELAKLAGLSEASVICEIMKNNGKMARLPDLFKFSKKYNIKITTIKKIIIYKLKNEKITEKIEEKEIYIEKEKYTLTIYKSRLFKEWYIAISYGEIKGEVTPVFLHKQQLINDTIDIIINGGKSDIINKFIKNRRNKEKGIFICLCNETIFEKEMELSTRYNIDIKKNKKQEEQSKDNLMFKWIRNLGVVASILRDLNIQNIDILESNLDNTENLSIFDIKIK